MALVEAVRSNPDLALSAITGSSQACGALALASVAKPEIYPSGALAELSAFHVAVSGC